NRSGGVVDGQHYLIEIVVGGGPEIPAPRLVERGDGPVLFLEEGLELDQRYRSVRQRSGSVELIVCLPADYVRIVTIVVRHRLGDALRVSAKHWACEVRMLARSMTHGAAIGIYAQYFGIARCQ